MAIIPLSALMGAAQMLLDADAEVTRCEERLKAAKERVRILREETLPGAMLELGLEQLTLGSGQVLKLVQDVYVSISEDRKPAALAWLVEHNFDGLIKTDVTVPFGKGERNEAMDLRDELIAEGLNAEFSETVHPQTLKAFVREQLADAASSLPLDLFGAWPVMTVKLTTKKS